MTSSNASAATTPRLNPRDHLRGLDEDLLASLLREASPPCVSIYMPAHIAGQQTRENPIRFKTLLQQARSELAAGSDGAEKQEVDRLLGELANVANDDEFWRHQLHALAVFIDASRLMFVRLPRPVGGEIVAVADSFHIKPLIRQMQGTDRYQLLAITQKSVTLYEGDLDNLHVVPLHPDVPRTLVEAIGGEVDGSLNVSHYGGLAHKGMFHGHHDNRDDRDSDLDRYFRVIDKAVYDYHGRNSSLPLYLAADVDYHDRFQKASHHPRLQKQGVRINPEAVEVDAQRLRQEMNAILMPAMHERTREMIDRFGAARAHGLGSDDIGEIAKAAAVGRVALLLVNADRRVGGRVDRVTGAFQLAPESDPSVDDALDDLAEMTLRTGGSVQVLPASVHPAPSGVAAVFRY